MLHLSVPARASVSSHTPTDSHASNEEAENCVVDLRRIIIIIAVVVFLFLCTMVM